MAETDKTDDKPPAKKAATRRKAKDAGGVTGAFPFDKDHYLSTESSSRRSHHDGAPVGQVQEHLGIEVTGVFNRATREAVMDYQRENDLDVTGVVDSKTWNSMKGG